MTLHQKEQDFWSLVKQINIEDDIRPSNLEEEKSRFFESLNRGKEYSPIFKYKTTNRKDALKALLSLKDYFSKSNDTISKNYNALIDFYSQWIDKFDSRQDSEEFNNWLFSLYGAPKHKFLKQAYDELYKIAPIKSPEEDQNSHDVKRFFEKKLEEFGFLNWKVKYLSMPSKIRIDSINETIYINDSSTFSTDELKRLTVHEVGTHILRYENGKNQSSLLFRFGFFNYLQTEEGLAILSEFKSKLLTNFDLGKYCLRLIACDLAKDHSYFEIYQIISKYIDENHAFAITSRVKRGMIDTSRNGGYSKDQVYFKGYTELKSLDSELLSKLYVGKIGISNINEIITDNDKIKLIPDWI